MSLVAYARMFFQHRLYPYLLFYFQAIIGDILCISIYPMHQLGYPSKKPNMWLTSDQLEFASVTELYVYYMFYWMELLFFIFDGILASVL